LEHTLNEVVELELKEELSLMKNFEQLNNEKVTPYFMSLAKAKANTFTLEELKNDNGENFDNKEGREKHITDFYEHLYKKVEITGDPSIENFLGDIAREPAVRGSILDNDEKTHLDRELGIDEFDLAVGKLSNNTAPGIDGISNRFIKRFWHILRTPLHRYALDCFEKGELSTNFRTAKIRLIPKKTDSSTIKNLRPISLLGCSYKLISRVFALRLETYMDKITKICQKGYSKSKQCQEVLISIIEGINKAKKNKKKGALISVDIKKAFDSTSHAYLERVYRFFNFGPEIVKWLKLLCTNRQACVIMEDENLGKVFRLERGNAQGDTISPYIFNLGYQILLFKLTFDLQIAGIEQEARGEEPVVQQPLLNQEAESRYPRKVFAFADDGNLLVSMDPVTIKRVKKILEEFGKLSWLECNIEKTSLMQVGSIEPVSQEIINVGFEIVERTTILGLVIDGNSNNFGTSKNKIVEKVRKEIRNWSRFNLSLPGRITIAKTTMYSQVNYLGCFLPKDAIFYETVENLIEDFVLGKLNIAKKRRYLSPEQGGIGLFKVREFLQAQSLAWVKRASNLDEEWKIEMYKKSLGSVYNIRANMYDRETNPILQNISENYEEFLKIFSKNKENYKKCFIFKNRSITYGLDNNRYLTEHSFTNETWNRNRNAIQMLKMEDLMDGQHVRQINNIESLDGLTIDEYNKLRGICECSKIKYEKRDPIEKPVRILSHI
jgi:hypothetical protein